MRVLWRLFVMVAVAGVGLTVSVAKPASAASQLQVTAQPALYPAFSPSVHYYVSRCNNQPVKLTVAVPSATTVTVDGQLLQSGTTFDTQVAVAQGQEFLISWSSDPQPYHVRCLPTDFPAWTAQRSGTTETQYIVVTPDAGGSAGSGSGGANAPYVAVFDNNGVPRWWFKDISANGLAPFDAKPLANGDLVWMDWAVGKTGTPYIEHRLDGTTVKTYWPAPNNATTDLHELQVLPNGNYFLAIDTQKTNVDVSPCEQPHSQDLRTVGDEVLEELDSHGGLLWSWDVADHIGLDQVAPGFYSFCLNGDPYHFNAIEPTSDGNIIASFRHLDAIFKIQVAGAGSGNILWKLGGKAITQSLTIQNDPNSSADFGGQHDPRVYSDGTVTIHDNGTTRNRAARGVRFQVDTTNNTATLVESVTDNLNSGCCGSARKLPGGNWLVDWGGTPTTTEITSNSTVVFTLTFSNVFSYRAVPVTDASYGDALNTGMNTQYFRTPQGGGPASTVPEAPLGAMLPFAGVGAVATAALFMRRRLSKPN